MNDSWKFLTSEVQTFRSNSWSPQYPHFAIRLEKDNLKEANLAPILSLILKHTGSYPKLLGSCQLELLRDCITAFHGNVTTTFLTFFPVVQLLVYYIAYLILDKLVSLCFKDI